MLIGTFHKDETGIISGHLQTLTLDRSIEFRPVEGTENGPAFRIYLSGTEVDIGAAWKKTSKDGNTYLSASIDDPAFSGPMYASLTSRDDGPYSLWWDRPKAKKGAGKSAATSGSDPF